jgi:hypothetical protein
MCPHPACFGWLAAQALDVIHSTKTEPCGNIRRINVEIPSLSVSDMRRLKATDMVSRTAAGVGREGEQGAAAAATTSMQLHQGV